jgi:hypothetical protein
MTSPDHSAAAAAPEDAAPTECKSCHDMLMEIHDPKAAKCEQAQRLIAAKKKLDVMLGLAPSATGETFRFGVAPYGGSNIIGTNIHHKLKDGKSTGDFCITVLVERKADKGARVLHKIPEFIDGIPTDVVALGQGVRHGGVPVVSGSNASGYEKGTIGALVNFGDADTYILSNQHVLNPSFRFGDGQPILDAGFNQIGTLVAWSEEGDQQMDAAIALVTSPVPLGPLYDGEALNPSPMSEQEVLAAAQPSGGFAVKKYGQRTGLTFGVISTTAPFRDVNNSDGTEMLNQWLITSTSGSSFSESGDSGSLIMGAHNNRPVGLLWGGDNSSPLVSYANKISVVQNTLRISKFL